MKKDNKKLFDLSGKVAIVTGAAGQLGGEYVRALLDAGASVAGIDIQPENPKGRLGGIKSGKFILLKADITKRASLEKALSDVVKRFGNPTVLVNNAALDTPPHSTKYDTGPFETYPEASWGAMIEVNLKGTLLCCQVIGGDMAKRSGGSIINISSIYGMLSPDQRIYEYKKERFYKPVTYTVSKAGVIGLTGYLATYWADKNVRVNALVLGGVYNKQDALFLKNYAKKVPLGRMARQDEYNGGVVFLASDSSSYMTGSCLVMDGGYSSW